MNKKASKIYNYKQIADGIEYKNPRQRELVIQALHKLKAEDKIKETEKNKYIVNLQITDTLTGVIDFAANGNAYVKVEGIEDDVVQAIADRTVGGRVFRDDKGRLVLVADREAAHQAAVTTLNEVLLPAMKEVRDKFGADELILPFVLKSAECMESAVAELERYLIKQEGVSKGKLVLCTVYGDVHDIGKNLVKTIFANNGYTVYDLGKQVPLQRILEKIKEVEPDALGLSALLVSTSKQMQYFVEHARQNGIAIPVLCGGAAINSSYINRIAREGGIYEHGVFYCRTAFDGLKVMNSLVSQDRKQFIDEWRKKVDKWTEKETDLDSSPIPYSGIKPVDPPVPPGLNRKVRLDSFDLDDVWKHINKKSLFVLQWGMRGKGASESNPEKSYLEWTNRVIEEKLFEPRAVYGYFRCHNLTPNTPGPGRLAVDLPDGQVAVFEFPRSSKEKHLCLADYFGLQVTWSRRTSGLSYNVNYTLSRSRDNAAGSNTHFPNAYDGSGFYALSTTCTHLGCTPNWMAAEEKFKCPCHGSGFVKTGVNIEGPAPRPLERYRIVLAEDGQILVDKNTKYQQEKGQWSLDGAYLPYTA